MTPKHADSSNTFKDPFPTESSLDSIAALTPPSDEQHRHSKLTQTQTAQTGDGESSIKNKLRKLVTKEKSNNGEGKADGRSLVAAASIAPTVTKEPQIPASPPAHAGIPSSSRTSNAPTPRSDSPHQASVASSLIFERNVQESTLSSDLTSALPAHIKTEDQIPPALEASSLAITDNHLGPEEVEIVTHTAHQPAAAIIAESIPSLHQSEVALPLVAQETQRDAAGGPLTHHEMDDTASNYGSLDPNDVRRVSFISFADVVHGEHAETASNHSLHNVSLTSATDLIHQSSISHGPISPTRSPLSASSQPFPSSVTTPPTTASGPGSAKGVELSPTRSSNASPAGSPLQHGELSIETLGQALRKTASRDLSGFSAGRSPPTSAV